MKHSVKTIASLAAVLVMSAGASLTFAQSKDVQNIKDHRTQPDVFFLQEGDVPNSLFLLPAPPDGMSITFMNDQARYNWGKTMRNTARGDTAVTDARVGGDGVPRAFSEAFGVDITKDGTPEIYTLIVGMREDARRSWHPGGEKLLQPHPPLRLLWRDDMQSRATGGTFVKRILSFGPHLHRLGDCACACRDQSRPAEPDTETRL